MNHPPATAVDRAVSKPPRTSDSLPSSSLYPTGPTTPCNLILFAEGAAAFEELTLLSGRRSTQNASARRLAQPLPASAIPSAVDFVQADRLRRKVAEEMARIFSQVDLLLVPSLRDEMLTITNFTGHPSLTLRAGFVEVSEARSGLGARPSRPIPKFATPRRVPHGVTLIGRLFDEGTIARVGISLERTFNVSNERPPNF